MNKTTEKKWYQSKTKIAALLIGVGPVLATIGAVLNGDASIMTALPTLSAQVGIIFGIFGIRNLPFINK